MYKYNRPNRTLVRRKKTEIGESIERKVIRILTNKEPISDNAPLIYTEKGKGVRPEYDIRTDRFEVAASAMDIVHKNAIAKGNVQNTKPKDKEENNNSESTESASE